MKKLNQLLASLVLSMAAASPAIAGTNCTGAINETWVGASGVYVQLTSGVQFVIINTNPDYKYFLATILAAHMSGKTVTVTFTPVISCGPGTRTDVDALGIIG